MLFHAQIMAFFTNLLIELVELIALALIVLAGSYLAWKLEENYNVTAGRDIVVGIAILIVILVLQPGIIGAIIMFLGIGALLVSTWKFIDQNQYSISSGFLGR